HTRFSRDWSSDVCSSDLDAHLAQDPTSGVACETLCKEDHVVLAGEITSKARVDFDQVVRTAIREIGYTHLDQPFRADAVKILSRSEERRVGKEGSSRWTR